MMSAMANPKMLLGRMGKLKLYIVLTIGITKDWELF